MTLSPESSEILRIASRRCWREKTRKYLADVAHELATNYVTGTKQQKTIKVKLHNGELLTCKITITTAIRTPKNDSTYIPMEKIGKVTIKRLKHDTDFDLALKIVHELSHCVHYVCQQYYDEWLPESTCISDYVENFAEIADEMDEYLYLFSLPEMQARYDEIMYCISHRGMEQGRALARVLADAITRNDINHEGADVYTTYYVSMIKGDAYGDARDEFEQYVKRFYATTLNIALAKLASNENVLGGDILDGLYEEGALYEMRSDNYPWKDIRVVINRIDGGVSVSVKNIKYSFDLLVTNTGSLTVANPTGAINDVGILDVWYRIVSTLTDYDVIEENS